MSQLQKPIVFQAGIDVSAKMPNVPLMNFQKALNADPTSYINAKAYAGEKGNYASASLQVRGTFWNHWCISWL